MNKAFIHQMSINSDNRTIHFGKKEFATAKELRYYIKIFQDSFMPGHHLRVAVSFKKIGHFLVMPCTQLLEYSVTLRISLNVIYRLNDHPHGFIKGFIDFRQAYFDRPQYF